VTRFAIGVAVTEILLTVLAAAWITWADSSEPFLTASDFTQLGIRTERVVNDHRLRSGSLYSYDTTAHLPDGSTLTASVRLNCPRAEYDARLAGERAPRLRPGDEQPVVNDESWPEEPGYTVRQNGRHGARVEIVRLHGSTMLLVRALRSGVEGTKDRTFAARGEGMARLVQEHLLQKLGWRDASW
jgi:hypothetical protein